MNNDEIFKIIGSRTLAKRLKRELDSIIFNYEIIQLDFNNKGEIQLYMQKINDNYETIYSFVFPDSYPFKPPKVFVNNKPYFDYLRLNSSKFSNILKYITNFNCLCCSSFLCNNLWSPAYTMSKILLEIDNFKKIKKNIIIKLLLDKVKEKYLINDIELDSWIFNVKNPYYKI